MTVNRDTKILEAILFASGSPVLEDDLKDKMLNKKISNRKLIILKIFIRIEVLIYF